VSAAPTHTWARCRGFQHSSAASTKTRWRSRKSTVSRSPARPTAKKIAIGISHSCDPRWDASASWDSSTSMRARTRTSSSAPTGRSSSSTQAGHLHRPCGLVLDPARPPRPPPPAPVRRALLRGQPHQVGNPPRPWRRPAQGSLKTAAVRSRVCRHVAGTEAPPKRNREGINPSPTRTVGAGFIPHRQSSPSSGVSSPVSALTVRGPSVSTCGAVRRRFVCSVTFRDSSF